MAPRREMVFMASESRLEACASLRCSPAIWKFNFDSFWAIMLYNFSSGQPSSFKSKKVYLQHSSAPPASAKSYTHSYPNPAIESYKSPFLPLCLHASF